MDAITVIERCRQEEISLGELALRLEGEQNGASPDEVLDRVERRLRTERRKFGL